MPMARTRESGRGTEYGAQTEYAPPAGQVATITLQLSSVAHLLVGMRIVLLDLSVAVQQDT